MQYYSTMTDHSGKFVLRISKELHAVLKKMAQARNLSLNQICVKILSEHADREKQNIIKERLNSLTEKIKQFWPGHIVGVVLFGSVVREKMYATSDVDLLLVMQGQSVARSLYRQWDESIDDDSEPQINPHFVCLPQDERSVGSLWLEVMNEGVLLWEKDLMVSAFLKKIKNKFADNKLKRTESHGHPYWVWEDYA